MNQIERMRELSQKLAEASKAYYQEDREIMSNYEYDALYDELQMCIRDRYNITAHKRSIRYLRTGYGFLYSLTVHVL